MALIPMKQMVTITPALLDENGNPQTDEWDRPITGTPYQMRCRVQEGTKLVRARTSTGGVSGSLAEEVVSVVQIYFDKHPNISYADKITYTDEYGKTIEFTPLNIEVKRNLAGKPILTVVSV